MLKNILLDVVKHTMSVGSSSNNIEVVKLTGNSDNVTVNAMDTNKTVVVEASINTSVPELSGELGIPHLHLLKGLLEFPTYKSEDSRVDIKRREEDSAPEEIIFKDSKGKSPSVYRLADTRYMPSPAKFTGTAWNVVFEPSKSKIHEFSALAGLYSSFENYFSITTNNGDIEFNIGDKGSSTHKASIVIAENVEGSISGELFWPINEVLNILKIGSDESPKLHVSSRGALQITLTSKLGTYNYILPARKR